MSKTFIISWAIGSLVGFIIIGIVVNPLLTENTDVIFITVIGGGVFFSFIGAIIGEKLYKKRAESVLRREGRKSDERD